MKNFKIKLLLIISAAALVALIVGLSVGLTVGRGEKVFSAPSDVKIEGDRLSWNAVNKAAGYTVKINDDETTTVQANSLDLTTVKNKIIEGDNTLSVKVNATDKIKESVYSEKVTYRYGISPEDEAKEFKAAVNALSKVTLNSEAAVNNAKTLYAGLSEAAKEVEGVTAAIETLKVKDCEFFTLLVDAAQTLTAETGQSEFADVKTGLDKAALYYATLIDNSAAAAAKSELDSKQAAYNTVTGAIKHTVDELADNFRVLLGKDYTETTPTKTDYEALVEKENDVDKLGVYAKSYWDETYSELSGALSAKKTEILSIAVDEISDLITTLNGNYGEVTLLYAATNVLGNPVAVKTAPEITLALDAANEAEVQVYKSANNVYKYSATFSPKTEGEYALKVSYSKNGGAETVLTYKEFKEDIYFGNRAISDGKIELNGASGANTYFDIYLTEDIRNYGALPQVTGFPLLTGIPVNNGMKVSELRRALLLAHPELEDKCYEVRFVVYNLNEADGVKTITAIKDASVSRDTFKLDLTIDDLRLDIFNIPDGGAFAWNLGTGGNIDYAQEIVDNATLWDEVKINIYDVAGVGNAQIYDFMKATPFAVYTIRKNDGEVSLAALDSAIQNAWKALPISDRKLDYTFVFAMQVEPNDAAIAEKYLISKLNYAAVNGNRQTRNYDMRQKIDNSIIDNGISAGSPYNFTLISGDIAGWLGQFNDSVEGLTLTTDNAADYLEVLIYAFSGQQSYMHFEARAPFANQGYSFTKLTKSWLREYFLKGGTNNTTLTFTVKLSIVIKETVNGSANPLLPYFYSSDSVMAAETAGSLNCTQYTFKREDIEPPTENQISFTQDDGGYIIFSRPAKEIDEEIINVYNGIFDEINGVEYIEIKFTVDDNDYCAYLFKEGEELYLYANTEKTGERLDCGAVDCGQISVAAFNDFVNAEYSALKNFDLKQGVPFLTKVVHDNSHYIGDGAYSKVAVTFPAI